MALPVRLLSSHVRNTVAADVNLSAATLRRPAPTSDGEEGTVRKRFDERFDESIEDRRIAARVDRADQSMAREMPNSDDTDRKDVGEHLLVHRWPIACKGGRSAVFGAYRFGRYIAGYVIFG